MAGAEMQLDTGFVWSLNSVKMKAFNFTRTLSRYRFVFVVEQEDHRVGDCGVCGGLGLVRWCSRRSSPTT